MNRKVKIFLKTMLLLISIIISICLIMVDLIILLKYSLNAPAGHNLPQKIGPKMNDIKKSITA